MSNPGSSYGNRNVLLLLLHLELLRPQLPPQPYMTLNASNDGGSSSDSSGGDIVQGIVDRGRGSGDLDT